MSVVFRIVDWETTGFPPNAGIVQIGCTDLIWEGKSMQVGQTFERLCNPGMPINFSAMGVHHITEQMIADKPHPQGFLDELEGGADYIVAHNLAFEAQFMDFSLPTICTLKVSRQLWPEAPDHKNQTLKYWLGLHEDPDFDSSRSMPAHGAGPDTYVTAFILKRQLIASAKLGGNFVQRLVEMTSNDPNKNPDGTLIECTFGKNRGQKWEDLARSNPGFIRYVLANDRADADVRKTCVTLAQKYRIR